MSFPNKRVARAKTRALGSLPVQALAYGLREPIDCAVAIRFSFYCPVPVYARPDLTNLMEFPQDALQAAGVLANDNLVLGVDNPTRLRCMCWEGCQSRRKPGKGEGPRFCIMQDTDTCPYAMTHLFIRSMDADEAALCLGDAGGPPD